MLGSTVTKRYAFETQAMSANSRALVVLKVLLLFRISGYIMVYTVMSRTAGHFAR